MGGFLVAGVAGNSLQVDEMRRDLGFLGARAGLDSGKVDIAVRADDA